MNPTSLLLSPSHPIIFRGYPLSILKNIPILWDSLKTGPRKHLKHSLYGESPSHHRFPRLKWSKFGWLGVPTWSPRWIYQWEHRPTGPTGPRRPKDWLPIRASLGSRPHRISDCQCHKPPIWGWSHLWSYWGKFMALGESHIRIWMNMEFSKLIGSLSQLDCASQWISDLLQQWPRIQHFMVRTSWFHAFPVMA